MAKKIFATNPHVMFDPISRCYYSFADKNDGHNHFIIHKSKDLLNWEEMGFAYNDLEHNDWAEGGFSSPECHYNENNGYYYLFYSAKVFPHLVEKYFEDGKYQEGYKIGVAISKNPCGPYKNISREPIDFRPYDEKYVNVNKICDDLFANEADKNILDNAPHGTYLSITNPNVIFDEGKIYLLFTRSVYNNVIYNEQNNQFVELSSICAIELNNEFWSSGKPIMPIIANEYKNILDGFRRDKFVNILNCYDNPQEWENIFINDASKHNSSLCNDSNLFIHYVRGKKYYCITYHCNGYGDNGSGIGIAFANNIYGPYKKYDNNPIIGSKNIKGIYSIGQGSIIIKDESLHYLFDAKNSIEEDSSLFDCSFAQVDPLSMRIEKLSHVVNVEATVSRFLVAPSILSANFAHLKDDINKVVDSGADYIHFDVMDGNFVDNISFGIPVLKCISKTHPLVNDVHLMINNPFKYIEPFVKAGADIITFHYEACRNDRDVFEVIDKIHRYGVKAGLSIKPDTPVEKIFKFLTSVDMVLIMSVEPGFGGQKFDERAYGKILQLHTYMLMNDIKNVLIEVDGGIDENTSEKCKQLGINVFVAGSYLFGHEDIKERIQKLKK